MPNMLVWIASSEPAKDYTPVRISSESRMSKHERHGLNNRPRNVFENLARPITFQVAYVVDAALVGVCSGQPLNIPLERAALETSSTGPRLR